MPTADSYDMLLDRVLACESPTPLRFVGDSHQRFNGSQQDLEFCYPCPPTFLLPISPAAHFAHEREPLWMVDRLNGNIDVEVWPIYSLFATAAVRVRLDHDQHEGDDQHGQRKNR